MSSEGSKQLRQDQVKTTGSTMGRDMKLSFMDDFCKKANIFTNKEAQLKHQVD